jgi:hypothetical protein
LVQEIFVKELRSYKPDASAKVDTSQVKKFTPPAPPAVSMASGMRINLINLLMI